jgi:hypothetical protein
MALASFGVQSEQSRTGLATDIIRNIFGHRRDRSSISDLERLEDSSALTSIMFLL